MYNIEYFGGSRLKCLIIMQPTLSGSRSMEVIGLDRPLYLPLSHICLQYLLYLFCHYLDLFGSIHFMI